MIIKEKVYEECPTCGIKKLVSDVIYGCDQCQKILDEDAEYLYFTVFFQEHEGDTERYEFCSWLCLLRKLKNVETDYFVSLPTLSYDTDINGKPMIEDFWDAITFISKGE